MGIIGLILLVLIAVFTYNAAVEITNIRKILEKDKEKMNNEK